LARDLLRRRIMIARSIRSAKTLQFFILGLLAFGSATATVTSVRGSARWLVLTLSQFAVNPLVRMV
jgi:hypothetical protein